MSAAWIAYRAIAPLIGALAPYTRPFLRGAERVRWSERMGETRLEGGCAAWIHGASMGESTAALALARELDTRAPGAPILLTVTTPTARERIEAKQRHVALAPIDAPAAVRRFLAGAKPARLFVVETEIWPHWLLAARAARLPVAFVSARLSERSVRRYRMLGTPLCDLVAGADAVLCQSEDDARRWRAIGAREDRTRVTGNLKFDALDPPEPDRGAARRALGLDPARPLLTLGSVRPGEARVLAAAWSALPAAVRARWQVVAVPRHAAALAGLEEEARQMWPPRPAPHAPHERDWRWDARAGVLPAYYGACDVAFVGASLVPLGGHNPLEPAARGAAVLMGPFGSHQAQAVERLRASGGIVIAGDQDVGPALARLLTDDAARTACADGGLAAVESLRGAAQRTVDELEARGLWPVR